jgi:proton-translocating NADH-quinone oxidoreductase chain M
MFKHLFIFQKNTLSFTYGKKNMTTTNVEQPIIPEKATNFISKMIAPFYTHKNQHLETNSKAYEVYGFNVIQPFYAISFVYFGLFLFSFFLLVLYLFLDMKSLLNMLGLFIRIGDFNMWYCLFVFFISLVTKRLILASMTHISFYVLVTFMYLPNVSPSPWTVLILLPLVFLVVVSFLRYFSNNLSTYFLYLKFLLLNFFMAYSLQLGALFYTYSKVKVYLIQPYVLSYYKLMLLDNHLLIKDYPIFSQNFLFKFTFICDDLSLIFMWLSYLLVCLCVYFLWSTMRNDKNFTLYISQLILLLVQLQLTFTALDIFTFFLAFESLLIPMIIMIALWGSKNNRQANNYLIFYTMVSAIPMLLSILYLKAYSFDTSIFVLQESLNALSLFEKVVIWLSFFFAFAVKTPMVPVHIWLPKTHVDAPTVGSVILAGVLLKVGLIGILRFLFPLFPVLSHFFAPYVTAIATIGVIYASLITLRQIDAKRIIAYSSVAHMNMAMVSLFSFNVVGLYSTIYLMLSHGLIASGLFFLVGFLYNRFHVRSIYYYSGLATCMPVAAIYFFLFTLANMAFPLTSGFIGEFLLLLGITLNNFYLGVLNSLSMLLTTVYSVLLFGRIFLGELKPWLEQMALNYIRLKIYNQENGIVENKEEGQLDLYFYERLILNVLFFYIVLLGICPQYLFNMFHQIGSFFYVLLPLL